MKKYLLLVFVATLLQYQADISLAWKGDINTVPTLQISHKDIEFVIIFNIIIILIYIFINITKYSKQ